MALFSAGTYKELPPWLADLYQGMAMRGENLVAEENPPTYEGQRLAPVPEEVRRANRLAELGIGGYEPFLEGARTAYQQSSTPFTKKYKDYMNPYQQAVLDRIAEEGNRNLNENIMPALEAKFVRLGQHGGSGHKDWAIRAARDIQKEISSNQAQALSHGYERAAKIFNADQSRALESGKEYGNLGRLYQAGNLADIATLMEQGKYNQQQQQAENNIGYNDFLRKQNYPWEMLNNLSAILQGIPNMGQTMSFQQTPPETTMNTAGSLGATALAAAALRQGNPPRPPGYNPLRGLINVRSW